MLSKENGDAPHARIQKKPSERESRGVAYSFRTLEDVICVCRELSERQIEAESSLFREMGGGYFLFLKAESGASLSFLSEFGEACQRESTRARLCEHGICICSRGAVDILSCL